MALNLSEIIGVLVAQESTEGQDATPTPGANALQLLEGQGGVQSDQVSRDIAKHFLAANPFVRTKKRAVISGGIELVGAATAGTSAPWVDAILPCGFAETLVTGPPDYTEYSMISTGIPTSSFYFYHNGELIKSLGTRGRVTGIQMGIDQFPRADCEWIGLPVVSEAAMPSGIDTSAFEEPPVGDEDSMVAVLDGVNIDAVSINYDIGGNLPIIAHSEGRTSKLTQRPTTGTLRIYRPTVANKDIRAMVENHAQVALQTKLQLSGSPAKTLILDSVNVQLGDPENADVDGVRAWDVPITAVGSEANQGVKITLGDNA